MLILFVSLCLLLEPTESAPTRAARQTRESLDFVDSLFKRPLSHDIAHYEPLHIHLGPLYDQHNRVRRSEPTDEIHVKFRAFETSFHLRLRRHTELFLPTATFTLDHAPSMFDSSLVYRGYLQGSPDSVAYVSLNNGELHGGIHQRDGEVYVIAASRHYFGHGTTFNSVIYRASDVKLNSSDAWCGLTAPDTRRAESFNDDDVVGHEEQRLRRSANVNVKSRTGQTYAQSMQELVKQAHDAARNAAHSKAKTLSDHEEVPLKRQRRALYPTDKVCTLALVADHTFYDHYRTGTPNGDCEVCAFNEMVILINAVNAIYEVTDFNGVTDHRFSIASALTLTNASDPNYPFASEGVPGDVLAILQQYAVYGAQNDYNNVCLGHLFTRRDFANGVLGLAFLADSVNAGGICQNALSFSPWATQGANTNVGLTSVVNYGQQVSSVVSSLTVAHELGHNHGSQHDPAECQPSNAAGGSFIMYAFATSGNRPNNDDFSTCSRDTMSFIMERKAGAGAADPCFIAQPANTCGNRVVEGSEQCDCGSTSASACTLVDACCAPGCALAASAVCSPFASVCCNTSCQITSGVECSPADECAQASFCDASQGYECPTPVANPDGTPCECDGSNCPKVCQSGACTESVCSLYGWDECECPTEPICDVCCLVNGTTCLHTGNFAGSTTTIRRSTGSVCSANGQAASGYCDAGSVCVPVDNDSLLNNLNGLFPESVQQVINWIKDNWYWVLTGVLVLIVLVVALRYWYRRMSPNEKEHELKKRRARELARRNKVAPSESHDDQTKVMTKEQAFIALKRGFPHVHNQVITDTLHQTNYDARAAIKRLMKNGYQPVKLSTLASAKDQSMGTPRSSHASNAMQGKASPAGRSRHSDSAPSHAGSPAAAGRRSNAQGAAGMSPARPHKERRTASSTVHEPAAQQQRQQQRQSSHTSALHALSTYPPSPNKSSV